MTPKEAEDYVRGRWDDDSVTIDHNLDEPVVIGKDGGQHFFVDMIAAASFTLQREEEIRQKYEEFDEVRHKLRQQSVCGASISGPSAKEKIWLRILAILESQLAALLVGWKEKL